LGASGPAICRTFAARRNGALHPRAFGKFGAKERTLGMQETKPANIQIIALRGQWTEESSQRAVRSWLKLSTSQKTVVDLIAAQDDSMAIGARKAFEELSNEADRERWLSCRLPGATACQKQGRHGCAAGCWPPQFLFLPILGKPSRCLCNRFNRRSGRPSGIHRAYLHSRAQCP